VALEREQVWVVGKEGIEVSERRSVDLADSDG